MEDYLKNDCSFGGNQYDRGGNAGDIEHGQRVDVRIRLPFKSPLGEQKIILKPQKFGRRVYAEMGIHDPEDGPESAQSSFQVGPGTNETDRIW
jgi:hypothetical protein